MVEESTPHMTALRIGPGVSDDITEFLDSSYAKAMVIYSGSTPQMAEKVATRLQAAGLQVLRHQIPDAEAAKDIEVVAQCWAALGQARFTRTDLIVGVGGGAVTDVAGFIAATWLRGVRVMHVPTSINGMVDAALGGKTGINTAEGKNLVGAFHLPVAVLADIDALATLPRRDLIAGMAEVIKCGFIADPVILELAAHDDVLDNLDTITELIRRAAHVKQNVVAQDLRESHLREILNYGHTFGHAIELAEHYTWRHGEAVAVGMVFVAALAHAAGLLSGDIVDLHRTLLTKVGLPVTYHGAPFEELMVAIRRDKKTRQDKVRFVVLTDIAAVDRLEGPSPELLAEAMAAVTPSFPAQS